ncbi:hypothetical protein ACFWNT_43510 [Streptomyces sp. NPDC058409]|uniref:hypothetical protein n=1 Tax=Streptomyces sp. NPDC058409 TaxID=3346484 RepID=UPI0036599618
MSIEVDPDNFPWDQRVVSSSPHSEGARGAITGRGFSDLNVLITWDVGPGLNPGLASRTWHSTAELDWESDGPATPGASNTTDSGGPTMRCSTLLGTDPKCTGTATHMLLYSLPALEGESGERTRESKPLCKPCGEGLASGPRLRGHLVPLTVVEPLPKFPITGGHRLVEAANGEEKCWDCLKTARPASFRVGTSGCPGRPESLHLSIDQHKTARGEAPERAAASRALYRQFADRVRMPIGDWRPVDDDPKYCVFFTFNDREYGVKYGLAGHRLLAEKLPNRGYPEPGLVNPEHADNYKQLVFHFHNMVNRYGSTWLWQDFRSRRSSRCGQSPGLRGGQPLSVLC